MIIREVFSRWEYVTHGFAGMPVEACHSRHLFADDTAFYLCLFFLGAGAVADPQPSALADRPRLGRHPRQRDRRPVDGASVSPSTESIAFAYSGGLMGPGGRAVRPQDRLSRSRHLTILLSIQFLLLVIVGGPGLAARHIGVRRKSSSPCCRPSSPSCAIRSPASMADAAQSTGIGAIGVLGEGGWQLPREARRRAGIFGPILVLVIPARAARHLRPLDQDPRLLLDLPHVQARRLPGASEPTCGRTPAMKLLPGGRAVDQLPAASRRSTA